MPRRRRPGARRLRLGASDAGGGSSEIEARRLNPSGPQRRRRDSEPQVLRVRAPVLRLRGPATATAETGDVRLPASWHAQACRCRVILPGRMPRRGLQLGRGTPEVGEGLSAPVSCDLSPLLLLRNRCRPRVEARSPLGHVAEEGGRTDGADLHISRRSGRASGGARRVVGSSRKSRE